MFLDLHEGILLEFAERQEAARRDIESRIRITLDMRRARRIASNRAWVKQDAAIARKRRRAQPVCQIARPAVTRSICPRCGGSIEQREGCRAPIVHPCRRLKAA
jgi:hypothetical protein